jgi:hypothetical protein
MPLPTPEQFLAKLAASPTDAAAFDAATRRERPHCKTRREAVAATLSAVKATLAESAAMKAKLAASKNKLAALESARALKTSPAPLMTTSMPTASAAKPAPQAATTTAAQFATPKLTITREDFRSLTPQDKGRFVKSGGTLV